MRSDIEVRTEGEKGLLQSEGRVFGDGLAEARFARVLHIPDTLRKRWYVCMQRTYVISLRRRIAAPIDHDRERRLHIIVRARNWCPVEEGICSSSARTRTHVE